MDRIKTDKENQKYKKKYLTLDLIIIEMKNQLN